MELDGEALLRAARHCEQATGRDDLVASMHAAVAEVIDADFTASFEVTPTGVEVVELAPHPFVVDAEARFGRFGTADPLLVQVRTRLAPDTRAARWSDVTDLAGWWASEAYHQLYAAAGIRHQLGVLLPTGARHLSGLSLYRRGADFTDADVAALDLLQPHLQAARNRTWLFDGFRTAMSELGIAMALVGRDGAVRHATDPFWPTVRSWAGPLGGSAPLAGPAPLGGPGDAGDLPPRLRRWLLARLAARSRPVGGVGPTDTGADVDDVLEATDGARSLVATLHHAASLTVLALEVGDDQRSVRALRDALGLTPRQAEVLLAVAAGGADHDIAAQLGIAYGTVRNHLREVFDRLGVRSRHQAAARALRVPGVTIGRAVRPAPRARLS